MAFKNYQVYVKLWRGGRDSNPGWAHHPRRFSRPVHSTSSATSPFWRVAWRRHPDSNRGSGLCRPVPYHLAMPPVQSYQKDSFILVVPEAGLEPARRKPPRDFKSLASTNSATRAWSGRRDSNPRPQPWQGCALPLSYSRKNWIEIITKLS